MRNYRKDELCIRDPFIIEENGKYYLTGSRGKGDRLSPNFDDQDAFLCYTSDDLENFYGPYVLFDEWDSFEYWAPEIHKYNDQYYLFGTIRLEGKKRGTYIFVSKTILGPYKPLTGESITPSDEVALDGTLFVDNGVPYLIYCHEWLQVHDGGMKVVELSLDLTHRVGEPIKIFNATDAKWVGENDRGGFVTDGPFVIKEDNKYKMIWSSFDKDMSYSLAVATSDNLFKSWEQEDVTRFSDDRGHGMLIDINNVRCLVSHKPNSPRGKERLIIEKFDF